MSGNGNVRVRVLISGNVQGVGFRAFTKKNAKADDLKLSGFVQNLNGTNKSDKKIKLVEAVFQGTSEAIDQMIERCKKGNLWSGGTKVEKLHCYPLKKDESEFDEEYPMTADINNKSVRIRVLISSQTPNQDSIEHIKEKADRINELYGWAQNLNGDNETIEAVFQGTSENVETMIQHCKNGSNPSEEVKVKELHRYPLKDDENSFTIIRKEKEIKGD